MSVKRTPPNTPFIMSQSESDLPSLSTPQQSEILSGITTRHKRHRMESSPPSTELDCFMENITTMIEALKTGQQSIMTKLSEDIAQIKRQNQQIHNTNLDIQKTLEAIKISNEDLKIRVENLEKERSNDQSYILTLEKKIENLEYSSRPACVELRNIPSSLKEMPTELANHVVNIGKVLNLNLQTSDMRDTYRLPAKPGKNRTIVVEFASVTLKNTFLIAARKYNKSHGTDKLNTSQIGMEGKPNPIYLSEYLPGNKRKLFYMAREYAKSNDFKFCWTTNGRIYLKKDQTSDVIRVEAEHTLDSIPITS